ncbi:hypothetical protein PDESU_05717 [Pontiella desulfatans]|uniref:Uncharacterized protein n=1 Tax=Pontiella desulfatans TaxID=2750659 RepID=A0A6C2UAH4_PONDE|nr:hypothetical protein PDESU_05717 [Pontiella desulfatans]
MKKTMRIVAVALIMAGGVAYACSGCGCESKKSDKDKTECGSSCKGEKSQTACGGSKKDDGGSKTA